MRQFTGRDDDDKKNSDDKKIVFANTSRPDLTVHTSSERNNHTPIEVHEVEQAIALHLH